VDFGKESKSMPKAVVVYTTRTGETSDIAQFIAEGIRFCGVEADVINATEIKNASELSGYDAYVFGSPTYHGEMLQSMKTLLFVADKAQLEGKVGGAFGAFGWSGEAPGRIYETMKNIFKMVMVSDFLRLKSAALGGGIKMAQDYGRAIGKKVGGTR
jgi:flavorubredoxin